MCEQEAEINSHSFMHCRTTANLWNMFYCILGKSWVMPRTSFEMLQSWEEVGEEDHKKIGGPYVKKETKEVMMGKLAVSRRSR